MNIHNCLFVCAERSVKERKPSIKSTTPSNYGTGKHTFRSSVLNSNSLYVWIDRRKFIYFYLGNHRQQYQFNYQYHHIMKVSSGTYR